ncbi:biliverdin-producing heme oxygenase [Pelagicoccus albus]|uniref:Biliverdin-producing heme oxygenase n=1 Tax=Pelagicoccus albus TaxID=415222 RepID=A0A7X1E7Z7_9BACT|nr:biliverdin-producing heme oxygenase [Pelagicoccus albus]MBC2605794.1 biliverdin-producing heme oxygenase [Pelagicoccus albus]
MQSKRHDQSPVIDVHQTLVERTRSVHEALHRHPILSQLMRPDLDLKTYQKVLVAYHGFFSSAEQRRTELAVWEEFSLELAASRLEEDLQQLKINTDQSPEPDFDWMDNKLAALGCCYALHGSRHGAVIIERRIATSLPDAPRRFFELGPDPEQWTRLKENLQSQASTPKGFEQLARGAQKTFEQLGQWVSAI